MLALRDLQTAFAAHLTGEPRDDLAAVVAGDSISAEARLGVYRHQVGHSLATALAATFSTVQAVVGEAFFRAMAKAYIARELPRQPVLSEYGGTFPGFVVDYAPARGLSYLADVARLDWALNTAFHSPLEPRLAAAELAGMPSDRLLATTLALAAGASLVRSRFPLDGIWRASQPDAPDAPVDLEAGGASLLVLRCADDAAFATLGTAEAAFVEAVGAGRTLEEAARAALTVDTSFDLSAVFGRLLALEVFAALR